MEVIRAAEKLKETLWGKDINIILEKTSDGKRYVPKKYIESLELSQLNCHEQIGLLIRPEYDAALDMPTFDREQAIRDQDCGVIVGGLPGIGTFSLPIIKQLPLNANPGKSIFLYYLLFRLLSGKIPVAFEIDQTFVVFQDEGVSEYFLNVDGNLLPPNSWALSDSSATKKQPCTPFLKAARMRRTWIIQATSPSPERWKSWKKDYNATLFVMEPFSIDEMTALGLAIWVSEVFLVR